MSKTFSDYESGVRGSDFFGGRHFPFCRQRVSAAAVAALNATNELVADLSHFRPLSGRVGSFTEACRLHLELELARVVANDADVILAKARGRFGLDLKRELYLRTSL